VAAIDPHPGPPATSAACNPFVLKTAQYWFRIYDLACDPLYFGKAGNYRFDSPSGKYGALYAGADEYCAFIETFGQNLGARIITRVELGRRGLVTISIKRPLRLVDLVRSGSLARIGADSRLFAGEHDVAQRWAEYFHTHTNNYDGIYYPARHDPTRPACALYDRVQADVELLETKSLSDRSFRKVLGSILDQYNFGLI